MGVGYVINTLLGIRQTFDSHFHSHIESFHNFDLSEIHQQVSFGYNNKIDRERAAQHFPKVPILYDSETDPMLFKSLRSFLQHNGSGDRNTF